ncbi:TetR/AcrR family transcriptional regulator [Ornithinibacillus scapharcae]|uniref:TetR/AcrR family transcriptional regulator n=1 Tax=Ornithinibacillus scapharcae TaxID=1147159 RepID=UPI000225B8B0|nr:TetR/AcrR family transcriptional regulator [Ornithinibacillus scapharcae]
MDTRSQIIEIATNLFQQKGYQGVGISEILKSCNLTKGALYYHFPNGKEELLIACLNTMNEAITKSIKEIFKKHQTTQEAAEAMIEKLVVDFNQKGTITGYTFSSIVSGMDSMSEPVRTACSSLYAEIQKIYSIKLQEDGISTDEANSMSWLMTASIEGAIMLSSTIQSSDPLINITQVLPRLV